MKRYTFKNGRVQLESSEYAMLTETKRRPRSTDVVLLVIQKKSEQQDESNEQKN